MHRFLSTNLLIRNTIIPKLAYFKVQDDILLSMDRQEVTFLVLLELSAAFDTIDHNLLLNFNLISLSLVVHFSGSVLLYLKDNSE